jgi:segregation and condensation protein A
MSEPADSPSPPQVEAESFAGPLDMLLEEVRRQNVAIEKIAMAPIVARFLEYVETAAGHNLNLDIAWLHMAATLIHWKAQSLLGLGAENSETDPIRDSLVSQLQVHRRQIAEELARRRTAEDARFSPFRGERSQEEQQTDDNEGTLLTVWDLIQQARELAGWVEEQHQARLHWQEFAVEPDSVTVDEMIGYLEGRLAGAAELDGLGLLLEQHSPSRRACLFLGMLQMVSDQQLLLDQSEIFGPIQVKLRTRGL